MAASLAELLKRHLDDAGLTVSALHRLTGVPRRSLANWQQGRMPRQTAVADLLHVARAFDLSAAATDQLLRAARMPSLATLDFSTIGVNSDWLDSLSAKRQLHANIPAATYDRLFGVEVEIDTLLHELGQPEHPSLLVVHGMGGVGKTSLVREATRRAIEQALFTDVIWLNALVDRVGWEHNGSQTTAQTDPITDLFEQIATALATTQKLAERNHLRKRAELKRLVDDVRPLIVVDNFETATQLDTFWQALVYLAQPAKIVITSRQAPPQHSPKLRTIRLKPLTVDAAVAMLQHHALRERQLPQFADLTRQQMETICSYAGHNPYVIKLLVAQMKNLPVSTYLARFDRDIALAYTDVRRSIFDTSWSSLSASAKHVLALMTLMHDGQATVEELEAGVGATASLLFDALNQVQEAALIDVDLTAPFPYKIHSLTRHYVPQLVQREHDPANDEQLKQAATNLSQYWQQKVAAVDTYTALDPVRERILHTLYVACEQRVEATIVLQLANEMNNYMDTRGRWSEWLQYLRRVRDVCVSEKNSGAYGLMLAMLATCQINLRQLLDARQTLEMAIPILADAELDKAHVMAQLSLANVARFSGEWHEAVTHYKRLFDLNEPIQLIPSARILGLQAEANRQQGKFDDALREFQAALTLLQTKPSELDAGVILMGIGNIHFQRGAFFKAPDYYQRAQQCFQNAHHRPFEALVTTNMACALTYTGQWQVATTAFTHALSMDEEINNAIGQTITLIGHSVLLIRQDDLERAMAFLGRANKLAATINSTSQQIDVHLHMLTIRLQQNQVDAATSLLREAERLAVGINDAAVARQLRFSAAAVQLHTQDRGAPALTQSTLTALVSDYEQAHDRLMYARTLMLSAQAAAWRNDETSALQLYVQAEHAASQIGDPYLSGNIKFHLAVLLKQVGQLSTAQEKAAEAVVLLTPLGQSTYSDLAHRLVADLARDKDRSD